MWQTRTTKMNPAIFYTESRLLYQHPPWQHSWLAGPKTPSPVVFQRPYPSRRCCWEAGLPTVTKLRCIFARRWYKTFEISRVVSCVCTLYFWTHRISSNFMVTCSIFAWTNCLFLVFVLAAQAHSSSCGISGCSSVRPPSCHLLLLSI